MVSTAGMCVVCKVGSWKCRNDKMRAKDRAYINETQEALRQQTATADVLRAISRTAFDLDTVLETGTRDVSKKPL